MVDADSSMSASSVNIFSAMNIFCLDSSNLFWSFSAMPWKRIIVTQCKWQVCMYVCMTLPNPPGLEPCACLLCALVYRHYSVSECMRFRWKNKDFDTRTARIFSWLLRGTSPLPRHLSIQCMPWPRSGGGLPYRHAALLWQCTHIHT